MNPSSVKFMPEDCSRVVKANSDSFLAQLLQVGRQTLHSYVCDSSIFESSTDAKEEGDLDTARSAKITVIELSTKYLQCLYITQTQRSNAPNAESVSEDGCKICPFLL